MATARRDTLLELQARAQKKWADEKTFEVSAPKDGASARRRPSPVVVVVVVVVVRRDSSRDRRSIDRSIDRPISHWSPYDPVGVVNAVP
jgi:hypothetical protein